METQQTLETISSQERAVSARKAQANRQNALKSTGPKTARGKAHSRRNSLKHGFFAKDLISGVLFSREDPREFQELRAQLRQEFQPVGISEELEVERIAVCWWKLKRVWRYENAEISAALKDVGMQEYVDPRKVMLPEHQTLISLLQNAEKEIEASGEISQESKEKMFATEPLLRTSWPRFEEAAGRVLDQNAEKIARKMAQDMANAEIWPELAGQSKPSWRQVKDRSNSLESMPVSSHL